MKKLGEGRLGRISFGNPRIPAFREEEILGKRSMLHRFVAAEDAKNVKERNSGRPTFTFLVHPRDPFDALECAKIGGVGLGALANFIPSKLEQELKNRILYKTFAKTPPFIIKNSEITVEGTEVKGHLVAVLLYGEQMLSNSWMTFAKSRIVKAIQLAQEAGSSIIGLGAHTSPATLGGLTLREKGGHIDVSSISEIGITTGNALTAGMSVEAVKRSVESLDLLPQKAKVGIVGASGSVGAATSRLLVEEGFVPILYSRSIRKLEAKFEDIKDYAVFSEDLRDMRQCDVIVVMTSASTSTLLPEHVSPGTIVIEDTQPRNIKEPQAREMRENGSMLIDGGYVHIPGYRCGFNFRFPPETTAACLAETLILTMEGRTSDYSLGDAQVDKAREMLRLAKKHNITVAPPTWNNKPIESVVLDQVRRQSVRRIKTVFQVA
jgi:predicted amino acid dehydrogenase